MNFLHVRLPSTVRATNCGRFANELFRQRLVRQRVRLIRQRPMSIRQRPTGQFANVSIKVHLHWCVLLFIFRHVRSRGNSVFTKAILLQCCVVAFYKEGETFLL